MIEETLIALMIIVTVIAVYACVMVIINGAKEAESWQMMYEAERRQMLLDMAEEKLIEAMQMWREEHEQYDQAVKADAGKMRPTLVPIEAIEDITEVRMYGTAKYKDPDNWQYVEVERYRDALFRHLLAYLRDPKGKDAESGIEHYKHLICNAAFICALERRT